MTYRCLAVALVLAGASPVPGQAQDSTVARAASRLAPPHVVRLRLRSDTRVEGPFERFATDTLYVNGRAVPSADVRQLWVRGRATKQGMWIGGTIGAVGLGLLGSVACAIGRSDDGVIGNEGRWADCAAIGGVLGFAAGGGIGALIGSGFPRWHLRVNLPL